MQHQPHNPHPKNRKGRDAAQAAMAPLDAAALERTQIGKYHTKGGTGFAAEDANNLADRMRGKDAKVVGGDNAPRGADRVVGGVRIQSKYYDSPAATMRSAFEPGGGDYLYADQMLEVPKDQYDQCLELMRKRIRDGKVPGHTDPADAEKLVKKGTVTYKQARNIARAGNIDSVAFDVKTGAATACGAFGISFAINYWQGRREGLSAEEAINAALGEALRAGSATLVTHVLVAQILRTKAAASGTVVMRHGVKAIARNPLGKKAVESIAKASLGKAVHGAAAVNHVSKLLRSNLVTGGLTTVVMCTPDFYRAAFAKSISWQQFTKNSVVTITKVAGGTGGWFVGAAMGATAGSAIPFVGTAAGMLIGGLLGSLGGGTFAGKVTKAIADEICEDDVEALKKILERELRRLSEEYMLDKREIEQIIDDVGGAADAEWFRHMQKETRGREGPGARFVRDKFEHEFQTIAKRRQMIAPPSDRSFHDEARRMAGSMK